MKSSRAFVISVAGIFITLLALNMGIAYAEELKGSTGGSLNALNSGYAITRWPWDGGQINVGQEATVRALTTEYPDATKVVFRWIRSNGSYWDEGPKDLALSDDTWDGKGIWDANDTQTLDMLGDWGVQALFMDSEGKIKGPNDPYSIVKIKAISWHVIPEVPLGTIATILSMVGGAGVFATVKRKS